MQKTTKQILTSAVALVVILGLAAGGKQALGAAPGQHCGDAFECKWGGVCIGKWCYRSCKSDADCSPNEHCGKTDVTVTTTRTLSSETRDDTEQICFANKKPK